MLADADEAALWAFLTCNPAADEAEEATLETDELATEIMESMVPWEVGATDSLSSLILSTTFWAAAAAAAGMIFVLKSSVESPAEIFQRPVSLSRASSFAAPSAIVIA